MKKIVLIISLAIFAISCEMDKTADGPVKTDKMVEFKGRMIDLEPYFEGFPYIGFTPKYKAGSIFYYHEDSTTMFKRIKIGSQDLSQGELIADFDVSKRNIWGISYNENDGNLYWSGDEINDEKIDLWRLNPQTRELTRLTDLPYIFGWGFNKAKNKIAFIPRLGQIEDRQGEVRILDLETMEETLIVNDKPEMRFTWSSPSWRPDDKGVVITAFKNADRTFGNLVYVDFDTKSFITLTDPTLPRSYPTAAFEEWLSNDVFIYFSNEDGFSNLYQYDLTKSKNFQLTKFTEDISDAKFIEIEDRKLIIAFTSTPIQSSMYLIDPFTGEILKKEDMGLMAGIMDTEKNKVMISVGSATIKFNVRELEFNSDLTYKTNEVLGLPETLEQKIVRSDAEKIEYPTFDIDPATGKQRMLHAYLFKPKNPLPPEEAIVMIQSFYGGGNGYNVRDHILGEAGIYVLSPAPRGSSGFGREFAALNDKDLGGNEIIDVLYAAKFISEKLGIPPSRVGVYGGSHGGYATMRCLTFPGEINGNQAEFDWGFGISHAGFSDIIHFWRHCNIPDWVTLEAGDPITEEAKLKDRSPLYHADKMKGRLLLTHGTNDSRVPIEGSRFMADSLRKYGKEVVLEEYPEMGHHIKGLEGNLRLYKTWFNFLQDVK